MRALLYTTLLILIVGFAEATTLQAATIDVDGVDGTVLTDGTGALQGVFTTSWYAGFTNDNDNVFIFGDYNLPDGDGATGAVGPADFANLEVDLLAGQNVTGLSFHLGVFDSAAFPFVDEFGSDPANVDAGFFLLRDDGTFAGQDFGPVSVGTAGPTTVTASQAFIDLIQDGDRVGFSWDGNGFLGADNFQLDLASPDKFTIEVDGDDGTVLTDGTGDVPGVFTTAWYTGFTNDNDNVSIFGDYNLPDGDGATGALGSIGDFANLELFLEPNQDVVALSFELGVFDSVDFPFEDEFGSDPADFNAGFFLLRPDGTFVGDEFGPVALGTAGPTTVAASQSFLDLIQPGDRVGFTWDANGFIGADNFMVTVRAVPEPTSLSLFGMGAVVLLRRRRL